MTKSQTKKGLYAQNVSEYKILKLIQDQ